MGSDVVELVRRKMITDDVKVSAIHFAESVEADLTPDEVTDMITQILSDEEVSDLLSKIVTLVRESYLMGIGVGYGSALLEVNEKADEVMRLAPTWTYEPEKVECCVCGKKIDAWGSKCGYPLGEYCCDECFSHEVVRARQTECEISNEFYRRAKEARRGLRYGDYS